MNNEGRKIVGYNPQTGEPIYEQSVVNEIPGSQPVQQPVANIPEPQPVQQPVINEIPEPQPVQPQYNQPVQQPVINEIPEPQPVQPQYNQPVQQPVINEILESQPVQPQYSQPAQPQYTYNPNESEGKSKLGIIIGIVVGVLALAVVLCLILFKNPKEEHNEEYENNNGGKTQTETKTTEYQGFKFTQMSGYTYEVEDDVLSIYNRKYYTMINVVEREYEEVETIIDEFADWLKERYTIGDYGTTTVSGKKFIYFYATLGENQALYYVVASPNSSYIFVGLVANDTYVANLSDLKEVAKIVDTAKYVGNYSGYSTEFEKELELNH